MLLFRWQACFISWTMSRGQSDWDEQISAEWPTFCVAIFSCYQLCAITDHILLNASISSKICFLLIWDPLLLHTHRSCTIKQRQGLSVYTKVTKLTCTLCRKWESYQQYSVLNSALGRLYFIKKDHACADFSDVNSCPSPLSVPDCPNN